MKSYTLAVYHLMYNSSNEVIIGEIFHSCSDLAL